MVSYKDYCDARAKELLETIENVKHIPYTRRPRRYRTFARERRTYGPTIGVMTWEYQRARCAYKLWLAAHVEATVLNATYYNQ